MINRDIYQKDPATRKLVNQGVASVNDDKSSQALAVLRYELETFVCDGQYEKGLSYILETFLANLKEVKQPAVWVSGFYGSGKSHLVKMLRALWTDTVFADGATARGIANLPQNISDSLQELSVQGRRYGGLHAISGTLGAGTSSSVRLALLRLVFRSVDLPEQYPIARFVMWLKREGILEQVRSWLADNSYDWNEELANFYVAEGLREALVHVKPQLFPSPLACNETLNNLYPNVMDVSSDEMLTAMKQALTTKDQFPLTLIVLDEVQQYIGTDSQRSYDVQMLVEDCCNNFAGKLLFIGTGQTAVTGTSNLKKLEGRFTVRVELSDTDVEAVIRKVILAKKPEARAPIEQVMQSNLGEISRHLGGTTIGHRQDDLPFFSQDYPILPVRRRFWENTLRVLDQTGTDSQLRNQLSMIHKVIQSNLGQPLGHVIPADCLYFDCADRLLQAHVLPRKVHEKTMNWNKGSDDERLMARASGLIFLINKLANQNTDIGIHATVDTLADLMVENLAEGSAALRRKLPALLDSCELLMKVGDEYRIQTKESAAWHDDFLNQCAALANEVHRVENEREDRLRSKFGELTRRLTLLQGNSAKVPRSVYPVFDTQLPADADQRICVWVRDGWNNDEMSVRADARQAGIQSPTIFVFIPKRSADDLRRHLINYKASSTTLETRGVPNTPEGNEAHAAMETAKQVAEAKIRELLDEAFSGARVFQGGGSEIIGNNLQEMLREAADNALQRLYPQFHVADHDGWSKVYEKAQKGAPDALKAIGDEGDCAKNPVCKAILDYIAGGKKGADIRAQFEGSPYGWSRDAIEGGLQVLLVAGQIHAQDQRGQIVSDPRTLERRAIGQTLFKVEAAIVTALQRIQIRKLMQKIELPAPQGEELASVPRFLEKMHDLAARAGGDAPKPSLPSTAHLENIRLTTGNAQLLAIYDQRDNLGRDIAIWNSLAERIERRWPKWLDLKRLMVHAATLDGSKKIQAQIATIEQERQLLAEPDPVPALIAALTQLLRDELNKLKQLWDEKWQAGEAKLEADANWQKLSPEQRYGLRARQQLVEAAVPQIAVDNTANILLSLDRIAISALRDRIDAMPARFDQVVLAAAKALEPAVQEVSLPCRTLKSPEDVDAWLQESRQILLEMITKGPVIVG